MIILYATLTGKVKGGGDVCLTSGTGDGRVHGEMRKALVVLSAVLVISCKRFDVVSDSYWALMFPPPSSVLSGTGIRAGVRGYRIVYRTVSRGAGFGELAGIIRNDRASVVLLSPRLSTNSAELMKEFPEVHFYYYRIPGKNSSRVPPGTAASVYGYSEIPFSAMGKMTDKLVYFIIQKENKKNYGDINLSDLE